MSSKTFEAVLCPLCFHPELWRGQDKCPGCLGGKRISRFKAAELYLKYPALKKAVTPPEMPSVKPEK